MVAKRVRRPAARRAPLASKELERTIVELLSALPHVRQILLEDAGGELLIWVVIDGPGLAFEERDANSAVLRELFRRYPDVSMWMHDVNVNDYGPERIPELLPEDAYSIFRR